MKGFSLLAGIALFAAGMMAGWLLANWPQPSVEPVIVAAESVLPTETISNGATEEYARTVWLTVEFDGGSSLVPAARLLESGILIASLYNVYPANSVYYLNAQGDQTFLRIVAANDTLNLIAFNDDAPHGFTVSEEDGSLYVGRSVVLSLPGETLPAQIESALQIAPNGRNYFNLDVARGDGRKGGPLTTNDPDTLVGFVTTTRNAKPGWMHLSGEAYGAIDADAVRTFVRAERFDSPLSVRQFKTLWARSPGGLRHTITLLAERSQWEQVAAQLEQLLLVDTNNIDIVQQALTLASYYAGHQLVSSGNSDRARLLMSDMRSRYPGQQPWCLVDSRALAEQRSWQAAFEQARRCLALPQGTKPQDSSLLLTQVRNDLSRIDSRQAIISRAHNAAIEFAADINATRTSRIAVLQDALALGEHAQLYRLLGDFEYDAQNYVVAQNHYYNAIRLDPSISAALGNRLRNSTQRADNAPTTEVDYERRGGGIVVTARLNDSPQSFRLLVDTGATYTALSGGTLLRLGMGNAFNQVNPVVELESAAGTIYAPRLTLNSMQIGSARVAQVPIVVLENLEGFDGLVGLSFLQHFDVSLDQDANKLVLIQR